MLPVFSLSRLRFLEVLVIMGCVQVASSSGIFELDVSSFSPSNPETCSNSCRVSICAKQFQWQVRYDQDCTYGQGILMYKNGMGFLNGSTLRLPFTRSWPGGFTLIVESHAHTLEGRENGNFLSQHSHTSEAKNGDDWQLKTFDSQNGISIKIKYRVRCDPGYYGAGCNKACHVSAFHKRMGHFECSSEGEIQCQRGWSGQNCNQAQQCKDTCVNGHCDRDGNCACDPGYEGKNCDQCVKRPGCKRGYCEKPHQCICEEGWGGQNCQEDLTYCAKRSPCLNGGSCSMGHNHTVTCTCPAGYTGEFCETRITNCAMKPCWNGGSCVQASPLVDFKCECPQGTSGRFCQITAKTCSEKPCMNGATCLQLGHTYMCACPAGWTGENCDTPASWCSPYSCHNGGHCVEDPREQIGFRCECKEGFSGIRCEQNIDDCLENPCQNGGTCIDQASGFMCQCPHGYGGQLCQLTFNSCQKAPCKNGGTCMDLEDGYKCQCSKNFTGHQCEVPVHGHKPTGSAKLGGGQEDKSTSSTFWIVVACFVVILFLLGIIGYCVGDIRRLMRKDRRGGAEASLKNSFSLNDKAEYQIQYPERPKTKPPQIKLQTLGLDMPLTKRDSIDSCCSSGYNSSAKTTALDDEYTHRYTSDPSRLFNDLESGSLSQATPQLLEAMAQQVQRLDENSNEVLYAEIHPSRSSTLHREECDRVVVEYC